MLCSLLSTIRDRSSVHSNIRQHTHLVDRRTLTGSLILKPGSYYGHLPFSYAGVCFCFGLLTPSTPVFFVFFHRSSQQTVVNVADRKPVDLLAWKANHDTLTANVTARTSTQTLNYYRLFNEQCPNEIVIYKKRYCYYFCLYTDTAYYAENKWYCIYPTDRYNQLARQRISCYRSSEDRGSQRKQRSKKKKTKQKKKKQVRPSGNKGIEAHGQRFSRICYRDDISGGRGRGRNLVTHESGPESERTSNGSKTDDRQNYFCPDLCLDRNIYRRNKINIINLFDLFTNMLGSPLILEVKHARSWKLINPYPDSKVSRHKMNGYFTKAGIAAKQNSSNQIDPSISDGVAGLPAKTSKRTNIVIDSSCGSDVVTDEPKNGDTSTSTSHNVHPEKVKFAKDICRCAMSNAHDINSQSKGCLLYTSPSPRDRQKSRMPSSA